MIFAIIAIVGSVLTHSQSYELLFQHSDASIELTSRRGQPPSIVLACAGGRVGLCAVVTSVSTGSKIARHASIAKPSVTLIKIVEGTQRIKSNIRGTESERHDVRCSVQLGVRIKSMYTGLSQLPDGRNTLRMLSGCIRTVPHVSRIR